MDVFSAEGELVNIWTAFHQCLFQQVIDFDTSSFQQSNQLPAHILQLRARLALRQFDAVLKAIKKAQAAPEYAAVEAAASYLKAVKAGTTAAAQTALTKAAELSAANLDNPVVQVVCAPLLVVADHADDALTRLIPHRSNIDAVAALVHLHLSNNRLDQAKEEVEKAKEWAQDNVVVNLAEAWVYLREGGDKYQSAYYVFEELASSSDTQSAYSLLGQAVSEIHLGRLDEAELGLTQAAELAHSDEAVETCLAANRAVVLTLAGKSADEELAKLGPDFVLARDLAEKRAEFAELLTGYSPVFTESV